MSSAKEGCVVFATILIIAAIPLFITALNGFSYYAGGIIVSGWAKASGYGLIPSAADANVQLYIGLRAYAYTYQIAGENYVSTFYLENSACLDAGNAAFALLVVALFLAVIAAMLSCNRTEQSYNSTSGRFAAMILFLVAVFSSAGWACWYKQCYVEQGQKDDTLKNLHLYNGFNCAVAGFVLSTVAMFIHCAIPDNIDEVNSEEYFNTHVEGKPAGTVQGKVVEA